MPFSGGSQLAGTILPGQKICFLLFSWVRLGIAHPGQRSAEMAWQNPAAHPLCGFESLGQLRSSLAASGLSYMSLQPQMRVLPALKLECPCHVTPFLPSRLPSALEGLYSSPYHHEGYCELVSGTGGELADLGVLGPQRSPILRAPDLILPICQ